MTVHTETIENDDFQEYDGALAPIGTIMSEENSIEDEEMKSPPPIVQRI